MSTMTELQQKCKALFPDLELRMEEPMAKHTSFRIGGPVEIMAFPKNEAQLSALMKVSQEQGITPVILGAGTNVLAPDAGMRGLVICLKDVLDGMEQLDETTIRIMSGVTMSRAAVYAANLGLSGMEFAHGIPGTVGGGVYMNAGAYGGEICQICKQVAVMDYSGQIRVLSAEEMDFSYRHSRLEEEQGIVLYAEFSLTKSSPQQVKEKMQELMGKRKASQPLEYPSAGSTFKRPAGGYAAALIEQTGLKGFRVGGAAVSEKHSGFVINVGNATAADVLSLMRQVSQRVLDATGILLEPEVRIW